MPANHCMPHTEEAKAKMSAAHKGKPCLWKHRQQKDIGGVTHYRCGRCGLFFAREYFHKSSRNSLGIKSDCKKCHSKISIASRNQETTRASRRSSEATRRARKAGTEGSVSQADWRQLLSILGESCLCCGSTSAPTQDHIVPLSKGGAHHPTNLQPLCRQCNECKQARAHDYRTTEQRAMVASFWTIEFKKVTP